MACPAAIVARFRRAQMSGERCQHFAGTCMLVLALVSSRASVVASSATDRVLLGDHGEHVCPGLLASYPLARELPVAIVLGELSNQFLHLIRIPVIPRVQGGDERFELFRETREQSCHSVRAGGRAMFVQLFDQSGQVVQVGYELVDGHGHGVVRLTCCSCS